MQYLYELNRAAESLEMTEQQCFRPRKRWNMRPPRGVKEKEEYSKRPKSERSSLVKNKTNVQFLDVHCKWTERSITERFITELYFVWFAKPNVRYSALYCRCYVNFNQFVYSECPNVQNPNVRKWESAEIQTKTCPIIGHQSSNMDIQKPNKFC